jgi:hypothetical protein
VLAGHHGRGVGIPAGDARHDRGDPVLSIMLSKAVLLAADDKIKDPTITSQLAAR